MKTNSFVLAIVTLAAATLSTVCLAGGRGGGGPVFHVGGFRGGGHAAPAGWGGARGGGFRWTRGASPTFGFRPGGTAVYGSRYGHTNTAFFGHTRTAFANGFSRRGFGGYTVVPRFAGVGRGFGRERRFASYAFTPRGRFRRVVPGFIGAGDYYGGDFGAGPSYLSGYAEPSLAGTYAEAPLGPYPDAGYYGGYPSGGEADYAGPGYGGGPRVIVVHANARRSETCSCDRYASAPVVYRFGVGSYY